MLFHRTSSPSPLSHNNASSVDIKQAVMLPVESLFDGQCHEHGSTILTSNLPFEEWMSVFGNQRLTGALLDCRIRHVHILELNGENYRLKQSMERRRRAAQTADEEAAATDPEIGEIAAAS